MIIKQVKDLKVPFDGEFFPENLPEAWLETKEWNISIYPWGNEYRPDTRGRVGMRGDTMCVLMYAREEEIQANEKQTGGMVCIDSCMEFFFQPFSAEEGYVNCEINPLGVIHIGVGPKGNRKVYTTLPEGVAPVTSKHNGAWWAAYYELPASFFIENFGKKLGDSIRANMYRCGGKNEHYGAMLPIEWPHPNFHCPEFFGDVKVEVE